MKKRLSFPTYAVMVSLVMAAIAVIVYIALPVPQVVAPAQDHLVAAPSAKTDAADPSPPVVPDATLSTWLNDRYEAVIEDGYCVGGLALSPNSTDKEWIDIETFFQDHFGTDARNLRREVSARSASMLTSVCRYAETPFALISVGIGEEYGEYHILEITGEISPVILKTLLPRGHDARLMTQLLSGESLALISRSGNVSMTEWTYWEVDLEKPELVLLEMCERWYGGGWSPYGDEPTIECELEAKEESI